MPHKHNIEEWLDPIPVKNEKSAAAEKNNPEEYGYPELRWHHYWGFMDGQLQILTREPDATHPANGRWEMWNDENRPLGVEPSADARHDFTNA